MKVLHISYADSGGGAAIGARRIHEALLAHGVDSRLLCVRVSSSAKGVKPAFGPLKTLMNRALATVQWHFIKRVHRTGSRNAHSINLFPSGLHHVINRSDADVVNLHWINNEMISIKEISKIKKPLVWTLHDMWPVCGAAHNVLGEYRKRFESGYADRRPSGDRGPDVDLWTWRRKKKHWKTFNPVFAAVSSWMADNVAKSALFPNRRVCIIPNVVDTDRFKPIDKTAARQIFGLPEDKPVIVFACTGAPYKGMDLMAKALRLFADRDGADSFVAVAFGRNEGVTSQFDGLPVRFTGRLNDEYSVAALYAAADLTCVPSEVESFGQTASESLSCGTPVVAFRCTGLTDIVDHKKNGYLADAFDVTDFCKGIEWVLSTERNELRCDDGESRLKTAESSTEIPYAELCRNARSKAVDNYSAEAVSRKYVELYKTLVKS